MNSARSLVLVALSALLAAPLPTTGQTGRTLRIAILDDASDRARTQGWQAFRARLREQGYAEGKNLVIETRYAHGAGERLPGLAAELVALKPHVIVAPSTPATQAAMKATSSIPIVFLGIGDPVGAGVVTSLARPGTNATGISILTGELGSKWVELLREIAPGAKRLAYLTDASNQGSRLVFKRTQEDARKLNVAIDLFAGQRSVELERSLEAIARGRYGGLMVGNPAVMLDFSKQIVQFAAQHKLPAVYARREYAEAGGLISYGTDSTIPYQRGADYVHRIVQGAKPSELPVERPSTFRMVLNLKTARSLGIAIPDSVRHRADELID